MCCVGKLVGADGYAAQDTDWILSDGHAGRQLGCRRRDLCTGGAAAPYHREAWTGARARLCLGFRLSYVEWKQLRMGPRKMGATSPAAPPLGGASLGEASRRMGPG